MQPPNVQQRIPGIHLWWFITIIAFFTAINVSYSICVGRLSAPPTYDDIAYLANGFDLLNSAYDFGVLTLVHRLLTETWHAPVLALQASLGFALTGGKLYAPYLLNGCYLLALAAALWNEFRKYQVPIPALLALSILGWPICGYLITEFRPDIPTNAFLVLGAWRILTGRGLLDSNVISRFALSKYWYFCWPFCIAVWLKPSFSAILLALWCWAWCVCCLINFFSRDSVAPAKLVVSFFACSLLLTLSFVPYVLSSGQHLLAYWTLFGPSSGNGRLWSPDLSFADNLNYYVTGHGGWILMKGWCLVAALMSVAAAIICLKTRNFAALLNGAGFLFFAVVAWAGLTILPNKSPWFGSIVSICIMGLYLMSLAILLKAIQAGSHIALLGASVCLIAGSIGLHAWPANDGALPALPVAQLRDYGTQATRVYEENCALLSRLSRGQSIVVVVPLISAVVNPDAIEFCAFQYPEAVVVSPRIYISPYNALTSFMKQQQQNQADSVFAILSEDFPGIMRNMPGATFVAAINSHYSNSSEYELLGVVQGPGNVGQVRYFRQKRQP